MTKAWRAAKPEGPSRKLALQRRLAAPLDFVRDLAPDFLALIIVDFGEAGGATQGFVIGRIAKRTDHSIDDTVHRRVVHCQAVA
jgi:hypothetical protein